MTTPSEPATANPAVQPAPARPRRTPAAEKPNTVTKVRPLATAALNAVNIAVPTAIYTGTAPVLAAVATAAVAAAGAGARKQMKRNKAATGSSWRAPGSPTGRSSAGRSGLGSGLPGSGRRTAGAGSVGLGGGSGRLGAQARRLARKLGGATAGAGRARSAGSRFPGAGPGSGLGTRGGRRPATGPRATGAGGGLLAGRGRPAGGSRTTTGRGGTGRSKEHSTGRGDAGMPARAGRKRSKLEDPKWVAQQRAKATKRRAEQQRRQQSEQQRRAQQQRGARKPGERESATGPGPIPDRTPRTRPCRYGVKARGPRPGQSVTPAPPQRPVPASTKTRTRDREPVGAARSGGTVAASGVATLIKMTQDVRKAASKAPFPDGAVDVITIEFSQLGTLVREQAAVFRDYYMHVTDKVEGVYFPTPVYNAIMSINDVVVKAGDTADKVMPLALKVCSQLLDDLDDPTKRYWDQRANPKGSGRAAA